MPDLSSAGSRILLVGTQKCANDTDAPPVPSVKSTMDDLAEVLTDRCGADPDNIIRVLDPADPMSMGIAVANAAEEATDVLLVHYVGHGFPGPDGELYLATRSTDPNPNWLQHNSLRYDTIRRSLRNSRASALVVILDCCFSGRATGGTLGATAPIDLADVHGGYVLTAGARDQLALAPKGQRHTAFTGELIRLLRDGDPASPAELRMRHIYRALDRRLRSRSLPLPAQRNNDRADELVLAKNAADGTTPDPSTTDSATTAPRKRRRTRTLSTVAVSAAALVTLGALGAGPALWFGMPRSAPPAAHDQHGPLAPAPPPPAPPPPFDACLDRKEHAHDRCGDVPARPTATNADGHLVTLVRDPNGNAFLHKQEPTGELVSNIGGDLKGDPVVLPDARGVLRAFAIGSEGFLRYHPNIESNSDAWNSIQPLAGHAPFTGKPAVAQDNAGRLTVVVRDGDGRLWRIEEQSRGSNDWAVPQEMALPVVKDDPTIQKDKNGALRVFVLGQDSKMWEWAEDPQLSRNFHSQPVDDNTFATSPSVTLDSTGKVHLFALGTDGSLQHNIEGENAATWPNGWHEIGQPGPYDGQPVAGKDGDNKVAVFVQTPDDRTFKVNEDLKVTPVETRMDRILSVVFKPDTGELLVQGLRGRQVVPPLDENG